MNYSVKVVADGVVRRASDDELYGRIIIVDVLPQRHAVGRGRCGGQSR